jgi:predicted translin family RNA/ssDNA-binding protein
MISKNLITNLKLEIEDSGRARSRIISRTHHLGREAKHAVFKLQRGEKKEAGQALANLEKELKALVNTATAAGLRNEGSLKAVIEEYLEAVYLACALQNKSLPVKHAFTVSAEEQLGALADLTGELVRAAVLDATKGNFKRIQVYRDACEELFGALLQMDLHSILRQKRDDARRNLKRLEEILYDVSLRKNG